jgi:hypothetical protein
MSNNSNAPTAEQYAQFSGGVQSKLWPALKGRMTSDEMQQYNNKPERILVSLRKGFASPNDKESLVQLVETTSPFFADEEKPSQRVYPAGYANKPVSEQLIALGKHYPKLDGSEVLKYAKQLSIVVPGAENWFAVPKREKIAKSENDAVEHVLDLIGKSRRFTNFRKGELGPKYLKLSEQTQEALRLFSNAQKGDYWLIPGQFGLRWRGRSVRRGRVLYDRNEFGFDSYIVGNMLLSHPERLVGQSDELYIDCSGDEYAPDAGGVCGSAPIFGWYGGEVEFNTVWVSSAVPDYGAASGFVPQFN